MGRFEEQQAEGTEQKLLHARDGEDAVVYVQARRSRWSLFRSWFGSFTLGVALTSLVFGIGIAMSRQTLTPKARWTFAATNPTPDVPQETIVFESDPLYSERPSDETDYAWNMLLPPGRGYVFVPDGESRGLAPGESTPSGPIYSVSMFHQLHCLARLRKSHWMLLDGVTTGELNMARKYAGRTQSHHIQHCFDYLRQAIYCAGDMTLEWPKQDGPSSGAVVDGWGIPHTCKSRSAIDDYMEKNHFNQSMNFDAAG